MHAGGYRFIAGSTLNPYDQWYWYDNVRIEVGYGTPPRTGYQSSYNNSYWATGDWADQHTPPRYHDFWNGYYQLSASMAATTHIYEVHIPSTSG